VIRAGKIAIQGEVFFDHRRTQRRGGDGNGDAGGMVGIAHRQAERLVQCRHGAQIHFREGRRIFGGAV